MKKQVIEFLSFLSIVFVFILMINGSIRVTYSTLSLKDYSMYLYINGAVGLVIYIINKICDFKFNKYEIMIFILAIFSWLSLFTSLDVSTAIFGKINRYEGLLVWFTYYILMLNAMNIKNKKYLHIIVFLIGLYTFSNIFYGLFQVAIFRKPSLFRIISIAQAARGFVGNPMCFGSLTGIFYGLILGLFIKTKVSAKKYILGVILFVANLGVLMSAVMSAMVEVFVINILCLIEIIILIIKKKEDRFLYLFSFILSIFSFILVFTAYSDVNPKMKNDLFKLFGEAGEAINTGEVKDNYGTGRIYIWKNTIEKIKEAPITGFGIDNYRNAFNSQLIDPVSKGIVDKAHNDYLQRALCEGVISGIYFVVFLLIIFFKGIFSKLSPVYYGLLLAFTGYSIQAFFNISVTRVAPVYFIVIGLLLAKLCQEKKKRKEKVDTNNNVAI